MPGGDNPPFDASRPSTARVYDYLLGGKNNFETDRFVGRELERLYPPVRAVLRENRAFIGRVVTWAARQGIRQFLDLGAGLPASPAVHHTAQIVWPKARVAYVDNDPLVLSHARALLASGRNVAVADADLTCPEAVMEHPCLKGFIDPGAPVCVLLACVLHFHGADEAREITAGYARLAAPGSVVAVSVVRNDDPDLLARIRDVSAGTAELHNHTAGEVASFLPPPLEVVQPGVVVARAWRGGMPVPDLAPAGSAYVLAGAGRKPR